MKSTVLSPDGKRLVARLKEEHGIELPDDMVIRRTYAGWAQKARGAWSWFFYSLSLGCVQNIGSSERVADLVRCKKISIYQSVGGTELVIEKGDY